MPEQLRAAKGIETETGIDGQADRQTRQTGAKRQGEQTIDNCNIYASTCAYMKNSVPSGIVMSFSISLAQSCVPVFSSSKSRQCRKTLWHSFRIFRIYVELSPLFRSLYLLCWPLCVSLSSCFVRLNV